MLHLNNIQIARPDDWHVHLREGGLLQCVINSTTRVTGKCIVMPNLTTPITNSFLCKHYKKEILKLTKVSYFKPYIPCYLTDDIDLNDLSYCKKVIYPTEEELKNHKKYIKSKFNKNFF